MRSATLILASLGLSASIAFAADQPSSASPRAACKADVATLCAGVQPGGGRIGACLKQNEAQVSAACKEAIARSRQNKSSPGSGASQGSPPGSTSPKSASQG